VRRISLPEGPSDGPTVDAGIRMDGSWFTTLA
jgi:hypothetical protein